LLVASSHIFRLLGLINLGVVILLAWVTFTGFTSLRCAFAALASFAVAIYLRQSGKTPRTALAAA
jgi:hypothetical protein